MKIQTFLFLVLCCLCGNLLLGQRQIVDNELILRLRPSVSAIAFEQKLSEPSSLAGTPWQLESIGATWRLYLLRTAGHQAALDWMQRLHAMPEVEHVTFNFKVQPRDKEPNDALYTDQWSLEHIHLPEVWDYTTGSITYLGDTIVIANLEDADYLHEDLLPNTWRNIHEIPNNNMDDDENGFKDDYFGYNTVSMNGNLPLMSIHGTEVFGIMAAKADNGTGVAGVNWNVKLMPINNDLLFSEIVESYEYVLKMRKLYNESKGELGAFIVTTNASFGTSGFPSDMPVFSTWCEFYDSLGVAGILSVGATSNDAVDIDIEGDMPTSCTSDFLVTVTAISRTNALIGGYSSTNIDIAAPGDNSPSTKPNNGYGNISGTSAAAPHVAGAIALLYSTPCEEWAQYARDDPPGAALLMKDFLLRSAAPLDALKGKSVSGGLLDVKGAFDEIQNYCGSFTGALDILTLRSSISDGTISIDYQTPKEGPYTLRVFDALGRLLIDMPLNLEAFDKKTLELDVRSFARGVYFLSIENVENIVAKPFVVF